MYKDARYHNRSLTDRFQMENQKKKKNNRKGIEYQDGLTVNKGLIEVVSLTLGTIWHLSVLYHPTSFGCVSLHSRYLYGKRRLSDKKNKL